VTGLSADVGGDQQLFERLDRVDVDFARAPLRCVRELDDLVEPLDDLLLRACEAVLDPSEKTHRVILEIGELVSW
jgi:hypothetical protein